MLRILVTGADGFVGRALRALPTSFSVIIPITRDDCDLTCFEDTVACFERYDPTHIIHLAAKVGGLYMNMDHNLEMFEVGVSINLNVLRACRYLFARETSLIKVVSLLSTCIFPDNLSSDPLTEDDLHCGPPHQSNVGYAYSKRILDIYSSLIKQCGNSREKNGFMSVIPCNLYGPNDNFDSATCHVIPALIAAAANRQEPFNIMGSGEAKRQFLYVDDLARALMLCVHDSSTDDLIIAPPIADEITITEAAKIILHAANRTDTPNYDTSKSNGQIKKTVSNNKFMQKYPTFKFTPFKDGIGKTLKWYLKHHHQN